MSIIFILAIILGVTGAITLLLAINKRNKMMIIIGSVCLIVCLCLIEFAFTGTRSGTGVEGSYTYNINEPSIIGPLILQLIPLTILIVPFGIGIYLMILLIQVTKRGIKALDIYIEKNRTL